MGDGRAAEGGGKQGGEPEYQQRQRSLYIRLLLTLTEVCRRQTGPSSGYIENTAKIILLNHSPQFLTIV